MTTKTEKRFNVKAPAFCAEMCQLHRRFGRNKMQMDLADFVGVSLRTVTRWGTITKPSKLKQVHSIAAFYELTPEETQRLVDLWVSDERVATHRLATLKSCDAFAAALGVGITTYDNLRSGKLDNPKLLAKLNALRAEQGLAPIVPDVDDTVKTEKPSTLSEILARTDAVLAAIARQEEEIAAMQRKLSMLIHQTQKTKTGN